MSVRIHEDDMDSPDLIAEYLSSILTRISIHQTRRRRGARALVASEATPTIFKVEIKISNVRRSSRIPVLGYI